MKKKSNPATKQQAKGCTEYDLAAHEAGHALMRWLLRGQATDTWIDAEGGMSEGDGSIRPNITEFILITMAGCSAEGGFGCFGPPDWDGTKPFEDIDVLRGYYHGLWKAKYKTENDFLDTMFDLAGNLLFPHSDLIEDIAGALLEKKKLTAAGLRKLCRRHGVKQMTPAELAEAIPVHLFTTE